MKRPKIATARAGLPPCPAGHPRERAGRSREGGLAAQVALEVGLQRRRIGVAVAMVLLERLGDDGLDVAAILGADDAEQRRVGGGDDGQRSGQRGGVELVGQAAGQQLVDHDAQRVDVGLGHRGPRFLPPSCSGAM